MTSMSPVKTAAAMSGPSSHSGSLSPRQPPPPKNVAFELLFLDSPQYRARLPMRVQIYPHDTTDSIVTTVKNFYGLYSGRAGSKGVSFEDDQGNTLIARYENFRNNMIVYVRVIEEPPSTSEPYSQHTFQPDTSATALYEGDGYARNHQPADKAPGATSPHRRSQSPHADGASRSGSISSKKSRSRSIKSHASNVLHGDSCNPSADGYSSGEGEQGSVSSRSKEQLGTTDISVENIVEGGRRKRAKFESSELPLFAPPQMPAATSNPSVSPVRRMDPHRAPPSYVSHGHNPFTNPRSLHGSQNYGNGLQAGVYATPSTGDRCHHRGSMSYGSSGAMGVLPTPDPTVGSCMSEEDKDVAIQLMRLGDMSNISHGRTSASTLDDTFSGRADAASSTGATSDGESETDGEAPVARRQKLDLSASSKLIYPTTESKLTHAQAEHGTDHKNVKPAQTKVKPAMKHKPATSMSKPPPAKPKAKSSGSVKMKKPSVTAANAATAAASTAAVVPMSPASTPHSRKPSVATANGIPTVGEDDQPDLSTKPRCQRCRKSKKGCDRQRPCGRCRDAGLSADQCISEDEGNGRKGRYGRHMGVPIKKEDVPVTVQPALLPAAPIAPTVPVAAEKNKKRKR